MALLSLWYTFIGTLPTADIFLNNVKSTHVRHCVVGWVVKEETYGITSQSPPAQNALTIYFLPQHIRTEIDYSHTSSVIATNLWTETT